MPNPIVRVLSTLRRHEVSCLLMGGQACVYYGAAEFSRDTDVALLASADNVARLKGAMKDLQAKVIAVPPLQLRHLERGHAVHFRCRHPEAEGMRLDVITDDEAAAELDAEEQWERRADAAYWRPLRLELEEMRHDARAHAAG